MLQTVTRRQILAGSSVLLATSVLPAGVARGAAFPDRPIRLLVGGGAGSVPDLVARLIGDKLSAALHQPVVIENRPGASGIIAMQALVSSPPDGYTLALATMSQLVFNSYLYSKLSYDPTTDVDPISTLATVAMVVAAHPSVPANTFSEFVHSPRLNLKKY